MAITDTESTNQSEALPSLEREIRIRPPFDKRSPIPSKNYGIHGMELWFYLKGPKGVVQFSFFTAQHLKHVADELYTKNRHLSHNPFHGMGADIGYHSPFPQYEGQDCRDCDLLPGGKCYYDGSSLAASEFEDEFLLEGEPAVWRMLEDRYHLWFDKEPHIEGTTNEGIDSASVVGSPSKAIE